MKKRLTAVMSMALLMMASSSFATNGYFSHGFGSHYKGMAGVGAAVVQSALGVAVNPAALSFLNKRYDVEVGFFMPFRQYTVSGNPSGFPGTFPLAPGTVKSDNSFFVIPAAAANWKIGEKNAIGLAFYGNGGMNTEYPIKTFDNPAAPVTEPTGVNLSQLFANVSYARQLGENHSVAASFILAYQWFKAYGLQAFGFFSSDMTKLTDNGHDNRFGYGFRLGYMGRLTEKLTVGASWQSKMYMDNFEDYSGLFAEFGGFDIPANWTAGLAYQFTDRFMLSFDFQRICYSKVRSIANPMDMQTISPILPDGNPNPNFVPLGEDEASGFGWKDMNVYKLGGLFFPDENWTVRAGYSYGKQPIESTEVMFNILAPGVIEHHITAGFTRKVKERHDLTFAAMYGLPNTVTGPNPFEAPGQQEIELKMSQLEFTLGFSF